MNKNGLNPFLSAYFQYSMPPEVYEMSLAYRKSKLYGIIYIVVLKRVDKKPKITLKTVVKPLFSRIILNCLRSHLRLFLFFSLIK
jgi:hypothetical protein